MLLVLLLLNGFLGSFLTMVSDRYTRLLALLTILIGWCLFYGITISSAEALSIDWAWIPFANIRFQLMMDTLSWTLCLLTMFVHSIVFLAMLVGKNQQENIYFGLFLLMQASILGVFLAQDAILFYCFWEMMLIPMYLCIGMWGSTSRSYAAMKFFIYTFIGSLCLLLALIYLGVQAKSYALHAMVMLPLDLGTQKILFLLMLAGFAVKIPMFPLHTWLPNAHTEAPTEGSVLLAALMLKVGAYGLLRIAMPVLPDACAYFSQAMIVLSLVAILYVGILAYSQTDIKRLIAYASVSHMGFVTLGLFLIYQNTSIAKMAYTGAIIQMITHAFGSGALFLSFGFLYARIRERNMDCFSGLATQLPVFSMFFMLFVLSTIGLPGTAGFVGEWVIMMASLQTNIIIGLLCVSSLPISAAYLLNMFRKIFYGKPSIAVAALTDISWQESSILALLSFVIIAIGIYPAWLFELLSPSVENLLQVSLISKVGAVL